MNLGRRARLAFDIFDLVMFPVVPEHQVSFNPRLIL